MTLLVCRAEVADSGLVMLWVLTDPPDSVLTVVMLGPLGLRLTDSVREGALAKAARALAPSMSAWSVETGELSVTGGRTSSFSSFPASGWVSLLTMSGLLSVTTSVLVVVVGSEEEVTGSSSPISGTALA